MCRSQHLLKGKSRSFLRHLEILCDCNKKWPGNNLSLLQIQCKVEVIIIDVNQSWGPSLFKYKYVSALGIGCHALKQDAGKTNMHVLTEVYTFTHEKNAVYCQSYHIQIFIKENFKVGEQTICQRVIIHGNRLLTQYFLINTVNRWPFSPFQHRSYIGLPKQRPNTSTVNIHCGRKPEYPKKTDEFGRTLTDPFRVSCKIQTLN